MFTEMMMSAGGGGKSIEDLSYVTFFYKTDGREYFGWYDEGYSEGDYKEDGGKKLANQAAAILDFSIATFNFTKVGRSGTITYKTDCILLKNGEKILKTKGTVDDMASMVDDMASMFNPAYVFKLFGFKD